MSLRVLDLYTLVIISILISATLSVVMMVVWRANKTYSGFGWWTAGNLIGALSFLCIGLRGVIPDAVAIISGSMLAVSSLLAIHHGVRVFLERPARVRFSISVLVGQLAATTYYYAVDDSVIMRIVAVSVTCSLIGAVSAYEFISLPVRARRFIHTFTIGVYVCFSLFMLARGVLSFQISILDDLYRPDSIQSLSFVLFNLFIIIWTFTFMVLNSQRLQEELETATVELEKLATTDYLTGIGNNRAFFERAEAEVVRSRRHDIPLSLVVFDIDHFKVVNDTFGHPGGDRMLKELAAACRRMTRQSDLVARIGGEEFGLLLTHADINAAGAAAENMRKTIECLVVEFDSETICVTASFGVAELWHDDSVETFIERADSCLYKAKSLGRNCVVTESDDEDASYLESVHIAPPPHISASSPESRV